MMGDKGSYTRLPQLSTDDFTANTSVTPKKKSNRQFRRAKKISIQKPNDLGNGSYEPDEERVYVDSLPAAFESATAQTLMVFIVNMTYLSVICLCLTIPLLSSVPGGFYDKDGMFKFISIGFKQHSALASFIWGVCTTFIGFTRFIAIVLYVRSPLRTILYSLLLTTTMGAGIVTVRYDEVIEMHFAAAGVWITSSLVFYGVVGAFNKAYSEVNRGAVMKVFWSLNIVSAVLFLVFLMRFNTAGRDPNDFLIAGISEYITAFLILVMDLLLAISIHTRFLGSAWLLTEIHLCADGTR